MKKNKSEKQQLMKVGPMIDLNKLNGKIDNLISMFQEYKLSGWTDVFFCSDYEFELTQHREETDDEYEKRVAEEEKYEKLKREKQKQRRIEAKTERKALYEKLKKEFEK